MVLDAANTNVYYRRVQVSEPDVKLQKSIRHNTIIKDITFGTPSTTTDGVFLHLTLLT